MGASSSVTDVAAKPHYPKAVAALNRLHTALRYVGVYVPSDGGKICSWLYVTYCLLINLSISLLVLKIVPMLWSTEISLINASWYVLNYFILASYAIWISLKNKKHRKLQSETNTMLRTLPEKVCKTFTRICNFFFVVLVGGGMSALVSVILVDYTGDKLAFLLFPFASGELSKLAEGLYVRYVIFTHTVLMTIVGTESIMLVLYTYVARKAFDQNCKDLEQGLPSLPYLPSDAEPIPEKPDTPGPGQKDDVETGGSVLKIKVRPIAWEDQQDTKAAKTSEETKAKEAKKLEAYLKSTTSKQQADSKTASGKQQADSKTATNQQQADSKAAASKQQADSKAAASKQQADSKTAASKQQADSKTAANKQQADSKTAASKQQAESATATNKEYSDSKAPTTNNNEHLNSNTIELSDSETPTTTNNNQPTTSNSKEEQNPDSSTPTSGHPPHEEDDDTKVPPGHLLETYRAYYENICHFVECIDALYQFEVGAMLFLGVFDTCFFMYAAMSVTTSEDLAFNVYVLWNVLVNLVVALYCCVKTYTAAGEVSTVLLRMKMSLLPASVNQELLQFSNRVFSAPTGITALQMFIVDAKTVSSVFAAMLTYGLVVLQFSMDVETIKCAGNTTIATGNVTISH